MAKCPLLAIPPLIPGDPIILSECIQTECELWDSVLEMCSMSATKALISMGLEDLIPLPWSVQSGVSPSTSPAYAEMTIDQSFTGEGGVSVSPPGTGSGSLYSPDYNRLTPPADPEDKAAFYAENGYSYNPETNRYIPETPTLTILSDDGNNVTIKVDSNSNPNAGSILKYSTKSNPSYVDQTIKPGDTISIPKSELPNLKVQSLADG